MTHDNNTLIAGPYIILTKLIEHVYLPLDLVACVVPTTDATCLVNANMFPCNYATHSHF